MFTNPPGDHAARLIEAAGLKGLRIGDASVSEKHANFIINHGAATAADVESLIGACAGRGAARARRAAASRGAHRGPDPQGEALMRLAHDPTSRTRALPIPRSSAGWPCCSAVTRASARSRSSPATPCSRRCSVAASMRTAFDPRERSLLELLEQRFDRVWIALHGPGGEDGTRAGRARVSGHALHRQRRGGLRDRHGQAAHQAPGAGDRRCHRPMQSCCAVRRTSSWRSSGCGCR